MLKPEDLQQQLHAGLSTYLKLALNDCLLVSQPVKSNRGEKEASEFAETFDNIFSENMACSLAECLYFFVKSCAIVGTVVTVGNKHKQEAEIHGVPPIAAGMINTFKVVPKDQDILKEQLEAALTYYIGEALFISEKNRLPIESTTGNDECTTFTDTFKNLVCAPLAESLAAAIDYYVRNIQIFGHIVTKGTRVTQTAIINPDNVSCAERSQIKTLKQKDNILGIYYIPPVEDLKDQIKKALSYYIPLAINTCYVNRLKVQSEVGQKEADYISTTFDNIFCDAMADCLSANIACFLYQMSITGTIITVGTRVSQTAIITDPRTPELAGTIPNTLAID